MEPVYEEYGRRIANGLTLSRAAVAPALFATAALGIKGKIPSGLRAAKIISDGLDGFVSEKDKQHKAAKTSIKSGGEMLLATKDALKTMTHDALFGTQKLIWVLDKTDGGPADRDIDKVAQLAEQVGATLHGDLPLSYLLVNIGRIGLIDGGVRPTYEALGIKTGATELSQLKTNVQDAHQFIESTGFLDAYPVFRKPLNAIGICITIASGIDIMQSYERQYLETLGVPMAEMSVTKLCLGALARTAIHLYGEDATGVAPGSSWNPRGYDDVIYPASLPAASRPQWN